MDSIESYAEFIENIEKSKLAMARMASPKQFAKMSDSLDSLHAKMLDGLTKSDMPDLDPLAIERLQQDENGREALQSIAKMKELVQLAKAGQLPKDISKARNAHWVETIEWELFGLQPKRAKAPESEEFDPQLDFVDWAHSEWTALDDAEQVVENSLTSTSQSVSSPEWANSSLDSGSISVSTSSETGPLKPPSAPNPPAADQLSFTQWILGNESDAGQNRS